MYPSFIAGLTAIIVLSLVASRLERWRIGLPLLMVLVGIVVGLLDDGSIAAGIDTVAAQHMAEVILAILLFVDASELRDGRLFGPEPRAVTRLLLIALPLSLAAAVGLGALLVTGLGWPALLVIACVVVPIDFAPASGLVRDQELPGRVRSALNVEGGFNDGIVSPIFLFALILADDRTQEGTPAEALATVVPFALTAIVIGAVLGTVLGWLMERATTAGWTTESARRVVVLAVPLLAYTTTVAAQGNGFVASFVTGIAFRSAQRRALERRRRAVVTEPGAETNPDDDYGFLGDTTAVLTLAMWFVVGTAAVIAFSEGVPWLVVIFCLAALTVVRVVPVMLAMSRSPFGRRQRLLVALLDLAAPPRSSSACSQRTIFPKACRAPQCC